MIRLHDHMIGRRVFVAAAFSIAVAAPFVPCAAAQPYPTKPIRMIVPVTPGGSTDVTARIVARKMSEILGRPIVVDNRPGASSIIGSEIVAKATLDEYLRMQGKTGVPLGRMGRAEEFANMACFLASDAGSYITGTAINVDGGRSPVV